LCIPDYDNLITALQTDSIQLIEWFNVNKMQANPAIFQVLAVGSKLIKKIHVLIFKVQVSLARQLLNCWV
jgi:hypothetical protein